MEIAERDEWTCQLCDSPVDPRLNYPHLLAASIDHVIPLSRGGADTQVNVQLAHLDLQ